MLLVFTHIQHLAAKRHQDAASEWNLRTKTRQKRPSYRQATPKAVKGKKHKETESLNSKPTHTDKTEGNTRKLPTNGLLALINGACRNLSWPLLALFCAMLRHLAQTWR